MSGQGAPPADPPDTFAFDVRVTLDDQLVLQLRCLQTPAMRAGRLRRQALIVLVAACIAPFALTGGLFIAWAGDPRATSFRDSLHDLFIDQPSVVLVSVLVMVGCSAAGILTQHLLLRSRMRRLLRRILRARPDVDPADPDLAYDAHISVNGEGVAGRTDVATTLLRWTALKRWEETGTHLLVLGDAMVGFCLSTAAADPAALARFRAVLSARLGPASVGTR